MKSWIKTGESWYRPAVEQLPAAPELDYPDFLQDWLAAAWLLDGVPFQYLVPAERCLPKESVRLFWLDAQWLEALLDGAVSVGGGTTVDQAVTRQTRERAGQAAMRHLYRPRLGKMHPNHTGKYQGCRLAEPAQCMGFLLRSRLLETYSALEVTGRDGETERRLLRLDLLSDTVMLGIFDGPVTEVVLREPSEGLHFGFRTNDREIHIRCVEEKDGKHPGDKLSDDLYPVPVRDGRMVEVSALADLFMVKLGVDAEHFTSAEFAMELLMTADEARLCRKEEP